MEKQIFDREYSLQKIENLLNPLPNTYFLIFIFPHVRSFSAFWFRACYTPFLGTKHFQQKQNYFFFLFFVSRALFQDERLNENFLLNQVLTFYGKLIPVYVPCRYLYNLYQQRIWAIFPALSFVHVDISARELK